MDVAALIIKLVGMGVVVVVTMVVRTKSRMIWGPNIPSGRPHRRGRKQAVRDPVLRGRSCAPLPLCVCWFRCLGHSGRLAPLMMAD